MYKAKFQDPYLEYFNQEYKYYEKFFSKLEGKTVNECADWHPGACILDHEDIQHSIERISQVPFSSRYLPSDR